jgi:hypothetical protein
MRIQDGASLEETRVAQKNLAGIIELQLPKEDFKTVSSQEKLELEKASREVVAKVH